SSTAGASACLRRWTTSKAAAEPPRRLPRRMESALRGRIAMAATLGLFALGLLLLALGGDSAVKGVSGLAQRLGMRPFVAGVLLLALATSLPELVVNLRAVSIGQGHLALGNAVGSTLA